MASNDESGEVRDAKLVTLKDYINENRISQVDCTAHIYKEKDEKKKICHCGQLETQHKATADQTELKEYHKDEHLEERNCECFGDISFEGFGAKSTTRAKYIRVAAKTEPSHLWKIMRDYWKVPPPKLIISVTGGAKCSMKTRLVSSFKRGLINAATSTDAWIITGGTNTGVMAFVGEAVREHTMMTGDTVVAVGIATWGIIDNKNCLKGTGSHNRSIYKSEDLEIHNPISVSPLDPNHTHFILVDNGVEREFGVEINLRASLEEHISKRAKLDTGVHVPVVSLVLGGGENTILTAAEACEKGTPIVVVKDSGRAADLIALAFRYTQKVEESDITEYPDDFDDYVRKEAGRIMEISKDSILEDVVKNTRRLLKKQNMITVFSLADNDSGSTKDMDKAVLFALLKANRANPESQLNLALAWQCADIAKNELFTLQNRSTWKHTNHLNEAMQKALVQNQPDFVQLFFDNGVVLSDFLTIERLQALYKGVMKEHYPTAGTLLLKDLINEKNTDGRRSNVQVVGDIIDDLVGDVRREFYQGPEFGEVSNSTDRLNTNGIELKSQQGKPNPAFTGVTTSTSLVESAIDPWRELFLWAVLLNRQELALQFWKNGKDHIGGALFASSILGALAEEADQREDIDLSQNMQTNADEFQSLAVGVLNECYKRDKEKSHNLLTRELDTWGQTTLFSLADGSDQMDFMEHSSCQSKLNRIWMGRMALYTSTWKILLGLIMPLMVLVIKFTTNTTANTTNISPQNPYQEESDKANKTQKLYKTTLWGYKKDKSEYVTFLTALILYYTTPFVKFCYHVISYVVFLCLFSFFVLTDLRPGSISVYEYVVWAWSITLIVDEFRQFFEGGNSFRSEIDDYFSSLWNIFDVLIFSLLIISVILRLTLSGDAFVWARMFYVLTLALLFLRFMQFFFVEKNIGPKVVMIRRMLTDLTFFLLILATFLFSYGVAQQALIYPNTAPSWSILRQVVAEPYWNIYGNLYTDQLNDLVFFLLILATVIFAYGVSKQALHYPNTIPSWEILRNVLSQPYWNIYGELFLEEFEGDDPGCSNNATVYENDPNIQRCPTASWLAIILNAIYMLLTNVLLLNLLIAMFSYTFQRVQDNSEKVYRFHRYALVYEYFDKPTLAPPFIIFSHIWILFKWIISRCSGTPRQSDDFHSVCGDEENRALSAFERAGMENYQIQKHMIGMGDIGYKVSTTQEKIEKVIDDLEQLREHVISPKSSFDLSTSWTRQQTFHRANSRGPDDMASIKKRMSSLDQKMEQVLQKLDRSFSSGQPSAPRSNAVLEVTDMEL